MIDGVKNVLTEVDYLKRKRYTKCMTHIQYLLLINFNNVGAHLSNSS